MLTMARLIRHEGRSPSPRTWVQMRWTPNVRQASACEAYGEIVWVCRPDAGGKSANRPTPVADDGDTKVESRQDEHD